MSFFGFEEKDVDAAHEKEDVPVFTWGEDSYDGLGDALQEGGDELNDETFGTVGNVGTFLDSQSPTINASFMYFQGRTLTFQMPPYPPSVTGRGNR
jgi:hypothetical protein